MWLPSPRPRNVDMVACGRRLITTVPRNLLVVLYLLCGLLVGSIGLLEGVC